MLTVFLRPFYLLLIFISIGLGLFFGSFPPDISTISGFGKFSAFLGTLIILTSVPAMLLYLNYKTALRENGFSGYFWYIVQFSLSGSLMVAVMAFIGFNTISLGFLIFFSAIALLSYTLIAHALLKMEYQFSIMKEA